MERNLLMLWKYKSVLQTRISFCWIYIYIYFVSLIVTWCNNETALSFVGAKNRKSHSYKITDCFSHTHFYTWWHIFQNREINFVFWEPREVYCLEWAQGYREKCSWQGWMFVAARALTNPWFTLRASGSERASADRPPAAENSPGPQVHTAPPPRRLTPRQQHSLAHTMHPPRVCALSLSRGAIRQ